jgi:PAS domain S-box-containing protein
MSGIGLIGDLPWGTHLCSFYQTKQDLLNMIIPYFKAGLESNEFCVWVVSDPLNEQKAMEVAQSAIPNFAYYLASGQMEIVPYTKWYYRNGELYLSNLISEWTQITEKAISRGFDGLRGAGYCAWVEQKDWESFIEYEAAVNNMIGQLPAILLCYFDLLRSKGSDVIDVVNSHQFALVNRNSEWEMIETFQHKMTEQALRDSEEKFRVLAETAACGFCIVEDDKISYANLAAEKITGYSRDELLNMKFWELIHPEYRQFYEKEATGGSINAEKQEVKILTRDNQVKWVILSYGGVVTDGKHVVLGTFYDITERKIAEEITQQQLYRVQKMEVIGKLASGMAHEINNQLTVIQAYLDLYAKDDSFSFIRSKIGQAVEKTSRLNRQLMLYSRNKESTKGLHDLNKNLKDLRKMLKQMIGEDVTIHYHLAEDLWLINADAANIEQVIVNLILNARDAMPDGGIIVVTTKNMVIEQGDHSKRAVCLSVSDTGTGMDDNIISQIFEPFFTTKGLGKGTGLGLTVVDNIIKAHGGWIDVQSTLGKGTTFNVYLPAADNILSRSRVNSGEHRTFRGKGERILLVEDDPDVADLTRLVLVENGYRVSVCRRASEALEVFKKNNFDLLISDLVLPDARGFHLAGQLRKKKPALKVLLVSGYSDDWIGVGKLGQEYPFLPKPYTAVDLLRKVHQLLKGHSARRPNSCNIGMKKGMKSCYKCPVI